MITSGDCYTKKTKKQNKNKYREQQGENMDTSSKQGPIHF